MVRKWTTALLGLAIFTICLLPASATNNGQYKSDDPATTAWFDSAHSARSSNCCSDADGVREGTSRDVQGAFVQWEMRGNDSWVQLVPVGEKVTSKDDWWFKVPAEAMVLPSTNLTAKPPGFAIIWFSWNQDFTKKDPRQGYAPNIRCFERGSLV